MQAKSVNVRACDVCARERESESVVYGVCVKSVRACRRLETSKKIDREKAGEERGHACVSVMMYVLCMHEHVTACVCISLTYVRTSNISSHRYIHSYSTNTHTYISYKYIRTCVHAHIDTDIHTSLAHLNTYIHTYIHTIPHTNTYIHADHIFTINAHCYFVHSLHMHIRCRS
jgi:hypothetical protein